LKPHLKLYLAAVSVLILFFVWMDNDAIAQEVTESDFRYQQNEVRELRPGTAMLRSFALPGWGHYYVDRSSWRRGQFHLGADLVLITTWVYLHTNANMLEGNMYTLANAYAGINLRNSNRRLEIAVGNFMSLAEYNDAQLRSRNWDRILEDTPENRWSWQTDEQRIDYVLLRDRMERARQQVPAVISLMVLNRVVSGVHAFIQARNHNRDLPTLSFNIPIETGGKGAVATLRLGF
jgi:hypothetical protein